MNRDQMLEKRWAETKPNVWFVADLPVDTLTPIAGTGLGQYHATKKEFNQTPHEIIPWGGNGRRGRGASLVLINR